MPYAEGHEGLPREDPHGRRRRGRDQGLARAEFVTLLGRLSLFVFFAVKDGVVLVGYDNHAPKGPHRHLGGVEEEYRFEGLDELRADFARDLARARRRLFEGK